MQELAKSVITAAAIAAGLPEGRVMDQTEKDNLTLVRPRVELQFLTESYKRTGKKLGIAYTKTALVRKKELYLVTLPVTAHVLADNRQWLGAFCHDFVAALPGGVNDSRGNWVKIRAEKAEFSRAPDKRVGESIIEVFTKVNELFSLSFIWRITAEEAQVLIPSININLQGVQYGQEQ